MTGWSLEKLLANLHDDIKRSLEGVRSSFDHSTTKGDASELVWIELFNQYLPKRYQAEKAHVVDSEGKFSEQIDIVIFDRQYSPFIFDYMGQKIVPAESIYALFEAKQTVNAGNINYAQDKVTSVRRLHRTSLPIPHAGGTYPPKPPEHIIGGLLSFESDWKNPPLGQPLLDALKCEESHRRLDIGCVAAHGMFTCDADNCHAISPQKKPATDFLLELIARLQNCATVPMIDIRAYAKWLAL